jgi:hypothetical protein
MYNISKTIQVTKDFVNNNKMYREKLVKLFKPYLYLFNTYDGEDHHFGKTFKDNNVTVEVIIDLNIEYNDIEVLIYVDGIECDEYSYIKKAFELHLDEIEDKAYHNYNDNKTLYELLKEIL